MIHKLRKLAHPITLTVAGLACLAAAAFTYAAWAGLAATGVALLLIEYRLDKS